MALSSCNKEQSTPSTPRAKIEKPKPPLSYKIIKTDHRKLVENFHIEILSEKFDESSVNALKKFCRQELCTGDCNLSFYDTSGILDLIGVYPLGDKDYLRFADHFVASSSFDIPNSPVSWYPYQDIKYKKLGGKNWKKPKL